MINFLKGAPDEEYHIMNNTNPIKTDRLILRAVNLRGDTFDTYVINPNPPQD